MKKNWYFLATNYNICIIFIVMLFLSLSYPGISLAEEKKETVNIGLLFDGKDNRLIPFITLLRSELKALLGSSYDINIKQSHILNGQWTFATIEDNYNKLISDPTVHIIVGAGAITGSVISKKQEYGKPVIAIGVVDSIVQGLSRIAKNKSGIHNLTFIMGNRSIIKDLEIFHKVYPYKKLGFVYYEELSRTITDQGRQRIDQLMAKNKSILIKIPVKKSIEDVFKALDSVDAVYISYLGKFDGKDKQFLIKELNKRKIPSFGSSISDTRSGMLAAMAPDDIITTMARRITLNIEAILDGQNPADLKTFTNFEKNLTINMKTAAQIDFSPKFTILSQADLINEYYNDAEETVNLLDVMQEVVQKNLDLEVSKSYVKNAEHDISKATSDYYPSFSAGVDGVIIDKKRADKSSGTQSERTTSSNIMATQLIYSDEVLGNITSKKYLHQAALFDYENQEVDVVFQVIEAYFKILKAKTSRKILKDNVDLIKQNLKTAQQREVIGYSGRSDVLRWQSQLATASTDLLAAKQDVGLARNDLNRILNWNQDKLIHIEDTSMDEDIFSNYSADSIERYIDNQKSLDIFTRFYVNQCIDNSFEIKALNKEMSSLERSIISLKRKYYLPTVSFSATQDHVFSRNGAGADVSNSNPVDNPWSAGVYLDLPFYEGGSKSIDIKKIMVEISRIQKQKLLLVHDIENSARIVLSDVLVKMVSLESSQQAAAYAKQNLELVQDSYAKGTVSVVELADAQNNSLTAELAALSSVYEYLVSLFEMEKVYGRFSLLMPLDSNERMTYKFRQYYHSIN